MNIRNGGVTLIESIGQVKPDASRNQIGKLLGSRLTYKCCYGFTLIELLVVVLIIGILVAVALPQYQYAVGKSRYASIKHMTETLYQAQQLYYLTHGEYAKDFTKLDLHLGDKNYQNSFSFQNGSCYKYVPNQNAERAGYVYCQLNATPNISYLKYFSGKRTCVAYGDALATRICKAETNNTQDRSHPHATGWYSYP